MSATSAWAPPAATTAALTVADSWLVDDGTVRALDRHWQRFAGACRREGVDVAALRGPLEAALPRRGRWFPRVELRADGALRLDLRPALAPTDDPVLAWVCDAPDPRRAPRRKGPDLALLGTLRERAAARGAGEALLVDGDGRLLEGAYSSLLWWEGDKLWAVPDDAPILPGVTRRLLLDLAAGAGVEVRFRRPLPTELQGREVWLTSALHGIRPLAPGADGPPRSPAWRRRLDALARPLEGDRAGGVSTSSASPIQTRHTPPRSRP